MVVPYKHESSLAELDDATTSELMILAKRAQRILQQEYKPDGFNIGLNLGRVAGAGVRDHLHLHIVPRWAGDANFMSVIGETRTVPEELSETYDRVYKHF